MTGLQNIDYTEHLLELYQGQACDTLCKKCPNTEFFWSAFSCIRPECGSLRSKSPYSIGIQGNTDQKKLRIWARFTQR